MDQNTRTVRIIFSKDKIQIIEQSKIRQGGWEKVTTNELSVAKVFHKVLNKGRVEEIFEKSDYEVLGKMLYEILTANSEVKDFIEMLIDRSTKLGDIRYKVMLQFDGDTHELAGLPWEYLLVPVRGKDSSFYLSSGKNMQFDFVRDYDLKDLPEPPKVQVSDKLSVIWIFVGDRRVETEAKMDFSKCEAVFNLLIKKGTKEVAGEVVKKFEYFKVKDPTRAKLKNILAQVIEIIDGPYVLHFLGHAEMRKNDGPYIGLSSGGDLVDWVKANGFTEMFKKGSDPLPLPQMVVLQACESAQINEKGEGLALGLIHQGIPAVVAMQNEISLDSSLAFIKEFYTNILSGDDVAFALTKCRFFLGCNYPKEDPNPEHHYVSNIFGTPVLFTSVGDEKIQLNHVPQESVARAKTVKVCNACSKAYSANFYMDSCVMPNCNGTLIERVESESQNVSGVAVKEASPRHQGTSATSLNSNLRVNGLS